MLVIAKAFPLIFQKFSTLIKSVRNNLSYYKYQNQQRCEVHFAMLILNYKKIENRICRWCIIYESSFSQLGKLRDSQVTRLLSFFILFLITRFLPVVMTSNPRQISK